MAKKFGKVLLCTAAISTAVAAVYYFIHKKNVEHEGAEEEDYDDFSDEAPKGSDTSRSYVPLNPETPAQEAADAAKEQGSDEASPTEGCPQDAFTPLAEKVAQTAEKAEETVEEFFDEEDGSDEEPPLSDN